MKKWMTGAIAFLLACAFFTWCFAGKEMETVSSGEWEYYLNEAGTVTISAWNGEGETLTIPDEIDGLLVTEIKDLAFHNREDFTSIEIPKTVEKIGEFAFEGCSSITRFVVSPENENYAVIGNVLYENNSKAILLYPHGLTNSRYSVPEGVYKIKIGAFQNCDYLTTIMIPETVKEIEEGAFSGCDSLTNIIVSHENEDYVVIDNALCEEKSETLIWYPIGLTNNEYTIPDGIVKIGDSAFLYCLNLNNIKIPESVMEIAGWAFFGCSALESLEIPASVTKIRDYAFCGCDSLTSITIPESVKEIGAGAFLNCDNLTLVVDKASYAEQYAQDNEIPYTYSQANA